MEYTDQQEQENVKKYADEMTLVDREGNETKFSVVAGLFYKKEFYLLLKPHNLPDSMGEDEALVFKVTETEDGDNYDIVLDSAVIDAVFAEYERLCALKKN